MEIERKYLVNKLPAHMEQYPCRIISQGYLNTDPVVRIRRDNDKYELTYKSKGFMERQEYNLPLTREAYEHLLTKIDVFEGYLAPLILVEVEFSSKEEADSFVPPSWFGEDVTFSGKYHNSSLSQL